MSDFGVTIREVHSVKAHPNADRLDLVTIKSAHGVLDFGLVSARDYMQPGDRVVFFPVDSILPEWLIEEMGVRNFLGHTVNLMTNEKTQNRIRTARFRGIYSQGIIEKPERVSPSEEYIATLYSLPLDSDVTGVFDVTKYDPPLPDAQGVNFAALPSLVGVYDIQSNDFYTSVGESLKSRPVYVTEKIEGVHWAASYYDGEYSVMSRNYALEELEGQPHQAWEVFRQQGFASILKKIADATGSHRVTIRGELTGPGLQGNHYDLKSKIIYVFEIELDGKPVAAGTFLTLCEAYGLTTVPVLAFDVTLGKWLNGQSIKEVSDGPSMLNSQKLREGIVIKPMDETFNELLSGREMLKQRSPKYLDKTGN